MKVPILFAADMVVEFVYNVVESLERTVFTSGQIAAHAFGPCQFSSPQALVHLYDAPSIAMLQTENVSLLLWF